MSSPENEEKTMNVFGKVGALFVLVLAMTLSMSAMAQSKGKVLVVMSGGHLLNLKEGRVYATGYYLNELYVPLAALIKAGYTPVYVNPNGDTPSMDASSNVPKFFGGDDAMRMQALRFINDQQGLRHPIKLETIVGHTQDYAGVFIPGGHAPMIDLVKDRNLGQILKSFHDTGRPTALICHGPMALLSAMPDTEKYDQALVAGNASAARLRELSHGWLYAGYKITVFSKTEEQQIELPQLDGHLPDYNDEALASAGAKIQNAAPWKPNVVVDREVITGQQPFSDHAFADAFLAKLNAKAR
ncbi:type 1 glutamine amidotransferase domain-containing protein [Silvibacterium acidisoli]|uniref:type 1 glutamine amidotransferase domain-containing protein n=1 Tax=Acidobacteriaceae bacterium ZG23-2 TaxID=2883246 RepID=UPI00406BEF42